MPILTEMVSPGRTGVAVAISSLICALIAGIGRVVWDAAYQAREGALIGEYFVLFFAVGIVTAASIVGVLGGRRFGVLLGATLGNVTVVLLVGSIGQGFLAFRPLGIPFGFVLALYVAPVGYGIGLAARRVARAMGSGGGGR